MLTSCFSSKSSTGAVPKVKEEVVVYNIERQVTFSLDSTSSFPEQLGQFDQGQAPIHRLSAEEVAVYVWPESLGATRDFRSEAEALPNPI